MISATLPPVIEIRELQTFCHSPISTAFWSIKDSTGLGPSWKNFAFSRIAELERATARMGVDFKASEQAADRLRQILNEIELTSLPFPTIVPLSGNGLMAEWRNASRAVEITVFADGDVVQEAFENREFNDGLSQEEPDALMSWLVSGSSGVHTSAR